MASIEDQQRSPQEVEVKDRAMHWLSAVTLAVPEDTIDSSSAAHSNGSDFISAVNDLARTSEGQAAMANLQDRRTEIQVSSGVDIIAEQQAAMQVMLDAQNPKSS